MRFLRLDEISAKAVGFRESEFRHMASQQKKAMYDVANGQIAECKRLKLECPTCQSVLSFGQFLYANQCLYCGNPIADKSAQGLRVLWFMERCDALDYQEVLRLFDEIPFAKPRAKN